jgi:two-component system chemotaxis response regulator CheB
MHLERNAVYLPPDGRHVEVRRNGLIIPTDHPNRIHTPCVDVLFESAARSTTRDVIAVLLTGMGSDGALGLKALHEAGATTIAQEPSTCVAEGMPKSAIELGAVRFALSPAQIIEMLAVHCGDRAA